MTRIRLTILLLICLGPVLVAGAARSQQEQEPRLVLVDNPDIAIDGRLTYPLYIVGGHGYRIRCVKQQDEDAVIRGLGFLTPPSAQLNAGDPVVAAARPQDNPLLCPTGDRYKIRFFMHRSTEGEKYYAQFPVALDSTDYVDKLYRLGCKGLADGLALDLGAAVEGDPTLVFGDDVFDIACADGSGFPTAPRSFADWCITGTLDDEQRKSVTAILAATPQGQAALGNRLACAEAGTFLEALSSLNLSSADISDLAPLATLPKLTILVAAGNRISNIAVVSKLPNLVFIDLHDNEISNIAALASLQQLRRLDLARNKISDLRPLTSLIVLEKLDLTDNEIADIAPLREMAVLSHLRLARNKIAAATTEHLKSLNSLAFLDLSDNLIESFEHISRLPTNIEMLLQGNPAADSQSMSFITFCALNRDQPTPFGATVKALLTVTGTANCNATNNALATTTSLDLAGRGIADVSALAFFGHLTSLDLSDNIIVDAKPLGQLVELRRLDLAGNNVVDARPIAGLPRLDTLDLKGNPLDLASYINACLVRDSGMLGETAAAEVKALFDATGEGRCAASEAFLTEIDELDLGGAGISTVRYFGVLSNVMVLNLTANGISDVAPLTALPRLDDLDLSDNRISSLAGFAGSSLLHLSLAGNPIETFDPSGVPRLVTLDLSRTSVRDISVLAALPALQRARLRDLAIDFSHFGIYCLADRLDPDALGASRDFVKAATVIADAAGVDRADCPAVGEWAQGLQLLNLSNDGLTSIEPVRGFSSLEELHLSHNEIADLRPLGELQSLKKLSLDHNVISNLTGLPPSIVHLSAENNEIDSIRPLLGMAFLETADLADNLIEDIDGMGSLPRLRHIGITGNQIGQVGNAQRLRPNLRGNPMCDPNDLGLNPDREEFLEQCGAGRLRQPPFVFRGPTEITEPGLITGPTPFPIPRPDFDNMMLTQPQR